MTTKEVGFIEEAIKSETLCAKKLELWRDQIRDQELRRLAEECIQGCRQDVDMLLNELRG